MKSLLLLLLFVVSAFSAPPLGYYDSAAGKTGAELRAALHEIINDHTSFPYSGGATNTSHALKRLDEDPSNTNNVILLYSQRSEPKGTFGLTTGWNREHVWPNSYGLDDVRPAYTDLFNLRAADANVNSARGNKYYDLSDPLATGYKQPAHSEAPLTSTDFDSWQPPETVRGDIARSIFYMDVRYEGDRANEPDLVAKDLIAEISSTTNFMGRLATLLRWHEQDPVDDAEWLRNDLIYEVYQKNRNPFIDNPQWVQEIFHPEIKAELAGDDVEIIWSSEFPDATLHISTNILGPWASAGGTRTIAGSEIRQREEIVPGRNFYRLRIE